MLARITVITANQWVLTLITLHKKGIASVQLAKGLGHYRLRH